MILQSFAVYCISTKFAYYLFITIIIATLFIVAHAHKYLHVHARAHTNLKQDPILRGRKNAPKPTTRVRYAQQEVMLVLQKA